MDWWWLERYHLTPDQVAALPLNTRDRVPLIAAEADEITKAEVKKAG